MRRTMLVGIMSIISLLLFVHPIMPQQGGKVLLIVRDMKIPDPSNLELMMTKEAGVMKEMLQKAGYTVEMATPTGEPWGSPTLALKSDRKLSDVNVADYRGFVIPCLGINSTALHPDLAALIKSAVDNGKPIAAQAGGVPLLAKAGVMSGKKYAIVGTVAAELKDAIYSGSGVVQDGKIITSGICPMAARDYKGMQDGTPKLMEALIGELKQSK